MRVLVVGTGIIGSTYGWQLSLAGYSVTHWVRDEASERRLADDGLSMSCLDLRGRKPAQAEVVYRPAATSEPARNSWDLLIVSVKSQQLAELLPRLRGLDAGTILFLQNLRLGEDALIGTQLEADRYVIGYPFKAGGGKDQSGIRTVIFGGRLTHTMLGHPDGRISPALRSVARAMGAANMAPKLTRRIVAYVRTHYVWAAASVAAFLKAGSFDRFLSPPIQREAYMAMREGFEICRAQGFDPLSVSPTRYYYLPLWLLVPFTRRLYANEGIRRMFEGHVEHSPDEMRIMVADVLRLGDEFGLPMPTFRALASHVI